MLPVLFQSNSFVLYSYPLLMGLAWGIGYQYFFHHVENHSRFRAQILFWGIFISAWLGAKTLFIFTSGQSLSREFLISASFWMGGGFVFYGGLLGAILFIFFYHLFLGFNSQWIKWAVISLTLGHGVGRIGCFLAGCCYGDITKAWWGIYLHGHDRHPTQLLEAFSLIGLGLILKRMTDNYLLLATYCLSYGVLRYILEILRADSLRGQWALGLTPSQWISIALVISGVYFIMIHRRKLIK